MNSHSRNTYYADDFESVSRRQLAFWIVCAIVILASSHLAAFYGGGWWVIQEARAEAAKIVTARRVVPLVNPPAQLLGCSRHDLIEYARTCRARARNGAIK